MDMFGGVTSMIPGGGLLGGLLGEIPGINGIPVLSNLVHNKPIYEQPWFLIVCGIALVMVLK